ncbi:BCAS3 microtubule associated cell migration factor-like isoform X2 [Lineus longissimus]|uniref:BCAS3 microtubule associated cell migration factor-like isoform X2 n=1 Tax=Lineus longissimus TaxID=88925 RepID=UPI00315D426A
MSAESPRRSSRSGGAVVRPHQVCDKSVLESVVGFFQDVVPQAYSGTQKVDDREKVQWVKFQHLEGSDTLSGSGVEGSNALNLLLIIGYTNGVQIWTLPESGEAQEVLSLRQGPVKVLRVLPTPQPVFDDTQDTFSNKRPLVALSDASSAGQPYCSVKFVSMKTGDEVHNITFMNKHVTNIECNSRIILVCFMEKIAAFDACQFKQRFFITTCYPSPGYNPNPVALGNRWLAYADKKLVSCHQSSGGMTGDGAQSYAATVISAAKTITKGLTMFGETVVSSMTGKPQQVKKDGPTQTDNDYTPGIVTILDIVNVNVSSDWEGEGLIAHFTAHATEPIAAMAFDNSGTMLLTACRLGHNFHVFKIMAHPWNSTHGAVHHIYTLHRGDTTAKVQDISFHHDSRWVAVSSVRGTTHIFPITPYGGPVTVRTHTSNHVVNRASRFHKSAGLDDMESRPKGRSSPVGLSSSPGSSAHFLDHHAAVMHHQNTLNNMGNPRMPPYPHPTTVYPLVQIRQPLSIGSLANVTGTTTKTKSSGQTSNGADNVCVAAVFSASRFWAAGSPNVTREKDRKVAMDSLFVMSSSGNLVEYVLDPHAKMSADKDKISEDSPIEVAATPKGQWTLIRSVTAVEFKPPLTNNNPLIMAYEGVAQDPLGYDQVTRYGSHDSLSSDHSSKSDQDEQWLSQVEIVTHIGPHRRLWMGPQFSFKTFQTPQNTTILSSNSSALLSQSPEQHQVSTMDIVSEDVDLLSLGIHQSRSSPVAMPGKNVHRASVSSDTSSPTPSIGGHTRHPLYIEAGSFEHSPQLVEVYGSHGSWPESLPTASGAVTDDQITETLADAMIETPTRDGGVANQDDSSDNADAMKSHVRSFDARSSPPHSIEHVLVFPTASGSPDHLQ